ncbi:uncharacterized protein METZ01_LOCUS120142, partial [marine metagenome]
MASNPRIIFGVSSSQMYKDASTNDIVLYNGLGVTAAAVMNIGVNKNVGIGKVSSSTHKLDVLGSMGISGSIIPALTSTFDLGSDALRFNDLYLDGDSIYIGDSVINDVSGELTVAAGLTVNALTVTNDSDLNGALDVAGAANYQSTLTVAGISKLDGALDVNNTSDFSGAMNLQAGLTVGGAIDANGTSDFAGDMNLQAKLTVAGVTKLDAALDVNSTSDFSGAMNLQAGLTV